MTKTVDFKVISLPNVFARKVLLRLPSGEWVPDPNWHRVVAETNYVLAEFLASKGLLTRRKMVERTPVLEVRWSELTDEGKEFFREHNDKWLRSIDQDGIGEAVKAERLERRWVRFCKARKGKNGC